MAGHSVLRIQSAGSKHQRMDDISCPQIETSFDGKTFYFQFLIGRTWIHKSRCSGNRSDYHFDMLLFWQNGLKPLQPRPRPSRRLVFAEL
ncbi:hypothetical protein I7I48_05916 [Histoplasma ohiense]|nr:hypothetical protein I7I48_05916 [Histoplasma ohiense (nom. inval.)]